mgnify:CR=1 FL=1
MLSVYHYFNIWPAFHVFPAFHVSSYVYTCTFIVYGDEDDLFFYQIKSLT